MAPFEIDHFSSTGAEKTETHSVEGYAASLTSILDAQKRIRPFVLTTPVLTSKSLNALSGRSLYFKCEDFQRGGAFKFRGACNATFSLPEHLAEKGVVTHSSGNHAAAVALASKLRGISATVVMPKNAPAGKVANVERHGGKVMLCEATHQAREQMCKRLQDETGAVLIHSSNDSRIISGQGTVALEFLEQVPDLDAIVCPISGGGLISGISLAAKSLKPSIKIFAAEPCGADDAARSKAAGQIVTLANVDTIADGLRASLGDLTWPVLRDLVEEVITVADSEIVEALRLCCEVLKIVVEPSAAIGLAAVLSRQVQDNWRHSHCKKIGVIVSGGNVDVETLWSFQRNQHLRAVN